MEYLHYRTLSEEEIEKLIERLIRISKEKGAKVTTQRILIFKELAKRTREHPSAEELYESLKNKVYGLSLSTVYRTLAALERLGLVRRIPTPDGKAHFELANKPHGHFICQNCGRVEDITEEVNPSGEILKKLTSGGYKVSECNFVCYGLCSNCSN
jgi:Fur family peroxide stress response transcriptional regulator